MSDFRQPGPGSVPQNATVQAFSLDFERYYRAVESRDARFDGWFITAVRTTGIYCRPSCPTPVRPKRENIQFYPTAAAAQLAGFRACKRCRPDASPGSPEWNVRGDLVGRAMRLIAEGTVDRDGVDGLARRLAVSPRHLHRLLLSELGAGPLAIARAQRAQTGRTLIETTDLPFTDVAFAAGFESVRQFNDTVREVFALTPTALRAAGRRRGDIVEGALTLTAEIAQAMVFGDRHPYLVAVVVPDADFAAAHSPPNSPAADFRALAGDPEFARAIGAVVARVNRGLSPIERVRRFYKEKGLLP